VNRPQRRLHSIITPAAAVVALVCVVVPARAQLQKPLSTNCGAYGAPDLQTLCTQMEDQAAGAARHQAARTDLTNSVLRARASRENAACTARINAGVANGRISAKALEQARANRQARPELACVLLRRLTKR
jgi:hypothetical protein